MCTIVSLQEKIEMFVKSKIKEAVVASVNHFKHTSYSRKSRLYCTGTAKSGTHSIAAMFDKSVRSQHEPEDRLVIEKIIDIASGKVNEKELCSYVQKRDIRLRLDIDSSQLNFFLINALLSEFNDALFLLTVRDCYSWLHSFINHSLSYQVSKEWKMLRDLRFKANELIHPPEEYILKEYGLYTLDGYLSYWAYHNQKVISTVPLNQLLIVKTNEITKNARKIAEFAGLPEKSIITEKSHAFKNPNKYKVLQRINCDYLEAKFQKHCGLLMRQLFPEVQSINDINL